MAIFRQFPTDSQLAIIPTAGQSSGAGEAPSLALQPQQVSPRHGATQIVLFWPAANRHCLNLFLKFSYPPRTIENIRKASAVSVSTHTAKLAIASQSQPAVGFSHLTVSAVLLGFKVGLVRAAGTGQNVPWDPRRTERLKGPVSVLSSTDPPCAGLGEAPDRKSGFPPRLDNAA
jgi:hypothetical protein